MRHTQADGATTAPTHRLARGYWAAWACGPQVLLRVWRLSWLMLWPGLTRAQDTLALPAHFGQLNLAGHWYANTPGHAPRNAAQALAQFQANQFERLPGNLGRGFVSEDVWLAFQVQQAPDSPTPTVVLGLQPAMLDSVTVYTAQPGQAPVLAGQVGDQVPKASQPQGNRT